MRTRLSIGEFATLTHLSVRTLRRYHEAQLLVPVTVDPFTGYRYYDADQIPTAQVIHKLRQLDVPLAEVESILATDDPHRRAEVITGHLQRLEDELSRTQAAVVSLRRLLRPDAADVHVELRTVAARTVAAITDQKSLDDSQQWYADAMAELDAAFAPQDRTGPAGGLYANELFADGAGTMTVYRPVRDPRPAGSGHCSCRPPILPLPCTTVRTMTWTSPTAGWVRGWSPTRWQSPDRFTRSTWSARGTPPTRPHGEPRSAGRCSGSPRTAAIRRRRPARTRRSDPRRPRAERPSPHVTHRLPPCARRPAHP